MKKLQIKKKNKLDYFRKINPYSINKYSLWSLFLIIKDSFYLKLFGVPKINSKDPIKIAKTIINRNAKKNSFWAASGHFEFFWVVDFGISINGLMKILDAKYIGKILQKTIDGSFKRKFVPTCFASNWEGFNNPFYRYDNLPWLIYSVSKYYEETRDNSFLEKNAYKLQLLIDKYLENNLNDGLLYHYIDKDWLDTVLRPSSTWNNLCVLMMLNEAKSLRLKTRINPKGFQKLILEKRFKNGFLVEYHLSEKLGIDASVLAIYLKLFNDKVSAKIIESIEKSKLVSPVPIKISPSSYSQKIKPFLTNLINQYHSSIWMHLGLMYLNGLNKRGKEIYVHKNKIDEVILSHQNFIEVLNNDGKLFKSFFHSTAYNFSMSAAQYLELTLK